MRNGESDVQSDSLDVKAMELSYNIPPKLLRLKASIVGQTTNSSLFAALLGLLASTIMLIHPLMYFYFLQLAFLSPFNAAQELSPVTPTKGVPANAVPILGIGTVRIDGNASEVIAKAIENGYRHIDCAWGYGNQRAIGLGIKEGLKRTGLKREDLWITGKLWNTRSEITILVSD
jgi:hypothetical protein